MEIEHFEILFNHAAPLGELVKLACRTGVSAPVRIHCLRSLLRRRDTGLTEVQFLRIWETILRSLSAQSTLATELLLTLKALMWKKLPRFRSRSISPWWEHVPTTWKPIGSSA